MDWNGSSKVNRTEVNNLFHLHSSGNIDLRPTLQTLACHLHRRLLQASASALPLQWASAYSLQWASLHDQWASLKLEPQLQLCHFSEHRALEEHYRQSCDRNHKHPPHFAGSTRHGTWATTLEGQQPAYPENRCGQSYSDNDFDLKIERSDFYLKMTVLVQLKLLVFEFFFTIQTWP